MDSRSVDDDELDEEDKMALRLFLLMRKQQKAAIRKLENREKYCWLCVR